MKFVFPALFIWCPVIALFGQQGFEVGGGVGVSYYIGDLNTRFDLTHPGPAATGIVRYNLNDRLSAKFGINYGFIRADDQWSDNAFEKRRNINFKSHIAELCSQFEFNFFPYVHGSRDNYFTPYLFAGLSVFYFNPYAVYGEDKTPNLRDLGTEGQFKGEEYPTIDRALVYGGGLKFDLNEAWSINFELSLRRLFTDYLDDVSTVYPDMDDVQGVRGTFGDIAVLASDPSIPDQEGKKFGFEGRQRGNSKDNDSFNFFTVGILYYFGNLKCPKIITN